MARINLLPWRKEVRERKNREFITLVVAVLLLSLLGAFAAWSYYNNTLESQRLANERIKEENTQLDKALTEIESLEQQRDDIIARMKVIQDLQGRRPIPVRVWDDIARVIPAQMYLTNMKREGEKITFTGKADNPNVIATFMRSLDGSVWLENSAVVSIQQTAMPTPNTTTTATNNKPEDVTATYPENNYVTFEVTTMIKPAEVASKTAKTKVASQTAPASATASATKE
ncbi:MULTISPECIES: PilN domain-containing protein [unclassified Moraxella]|uniref:PilN domain-containing protein n=1 Tax=unclassified Moraxella TaxID=2685852 RepID=UPI003AF5DF8B